MVVVTINYVTVVTIPTAYTATTLLANTASFDYVDPQAAAGSTTLGSTIIINPRAVYLPMVMK